MLSVTKDKGRPPKKNTLPTRLFTLYDLPRFTRFCDASRHVSIAEGKTHTDPRFGQNETRGKSAFAISPQWLPIVVRRSFCTKQGISPTSNLAVPSFRLLRAHTSLIDAGLHTTHGGRRGGRAELGADESMSNDSDSGHSSHSSPSFLRCDVCGETAYCGSRRSSTVVVWVQWL